MELKPCPFCGEDKNLSVVEGSTYRWIKIQCQACDAVCGEVRKLGDPNETLARVETEWNTRPTEDAAEQRGYERAKKEAVDIVTEQITTVSVYATSAEARAATELKMKIVAAIEAMKSRE